MRPAGSPAPRTARRGARRSASATAQLFDSMDPAPFHERDLDPKAADYIVEWAQETPAGLPLGLVVHLGREPATATRGAAVRCGRRVFPAARRRPRAANCGDCSAPGASAWSSAWPSWRRRSRSASSSAGLIGHGRYAWLVKESLVIGGWVALWRPLEIFLYDWWPIRAEAGCSTAWRDAGEAGRHRCDERRRRGMSAGGTPRAGAARAAVLRAVGSRRPERQADEPGGRCARQPAATWSA